MKKALSVILSVIAILLAAAVSTLFRYVAMPLPVPSQSIQSVTDTFKPLSYDMTHVYRISGADSRIVFRINGTLFGNPQTFVGATQELAGDIALTGSHIDIGKVKANARTFTTENPLLDGAMARIALRAGDPQNEFIAFQSEKNDFQGDIVEGQGFTFDESGELTISGVTKPVMFKVRAKLVGDTLAGSAKATIKRSDFNIRVPSLSSIATADDDVTVVLVLVANRVMQ